MRFLVLCCSILLLHAAALRAEGKQLLIFATLIEDTPVQLADGAKWLMEKGDSFPVLMFKEQQTKVVLQLVGTSFIIPVKNVRILEENQITDEALAAYRRNVASYLEGKVKKWRDSVEPGKAGK